MSVSTTKQNMNNSTEHNDINDPLVQDVLSEFRDELHLSKNKDINSNLQSHSQNNQHIQLSPNIIPPPSLNNNQPSQYFNNGIPPMYMPPQQSNIYNNSSYQLPQNMNKYDYMVYIDIELLKKNLIIVIIVFLIYNSGIINNIYDKIPEYLQENITTFDIYIKSTIIFIILYIISYLGYL
jgi:hypothetical protein